VGEGVGKKGEEKWKSEKKGENKECKKINSTAIRRVFSSSR
jgi:hypothetical protein